MPGVGQDGAISKGVREGVTEMGTRGQRLEGGEGVSHAGAKESMPGMSEAQCGKSSGSRKVHT